MEGGGGVEGGGCVGVAGPVALAVESLVTGFLVLSFAEGFTAGVLIVSALLCSFLKPWSAGAGACEGAAEY